MAKRHSSNTKKKSKKGLWIALGLFAFFAIIGSGGNTDSSVSVNAQETQTTTRSITSAPIATDGQETTVSQLAVIVETSTFSPTATPTVVLTHTPEPTFTPTPTPTSIPTPTPIEYETLKVGSNGDAVKRMQNRLIELEYLEEGNADGDFGTGTKNAVKAFQKRNGLENDGIAGQTTLSLLFSENAISQRWVYVNEKSGIYHRRDDCSGMKHPAKMPYDEACEKYKPCGRCY